VVRDERGYVNDEVLGYVPDIPLSGRDRFARGIAQEDARTGTTSDLSAIGHAGYAAVLTRIDAAAESSNTAAATIRAAPRRQRTQNQCHRSHLCIETGPASGIAGYWPISRASVSVSCAAQSKMPMPTCSGSAPAFPRIHFHA
jgi:hypothetical protein